MKIAMGEGRPVVPVAVYLGIDDLKPVRAGALQNLLKNRVFVGEQQPCQQAVVLWLCCQHMGKENENTAEHTGKISKENNLFGSGKQE